ncbi:Transcriptional regulator, IclR family, partial [hydrothermal vent metagenome]
MDAILLSARNHCANGDSLPAPTVAKTMAVIEVVGQRSDGLTHAEIVETTGCSSNLVHRVLSTLVSLGYMIRREQDRRYTLSNRLVEVCRPRVSDKSLVVCAQAGLRSLRDRSRETVQLTIESGGKALVLEQLSGLESVQVMGRVGMLIPLYSCAPGKALLAFMPETERGDWFRTVKLKSFTATTKKTRAALEEELRKVERLGYAEDLEEGLEGIRCVAAPIFDTHRRAVGAITVMAPKWRLPQRRFAEVGEWSLQAAAQIRDELL